MIPNIIHLIFLPSFGNKYTYKSYSNSLYRNMEYFNQTCYYWEQYKPGYAVYRWTLDSLISAARLYDQPEVAEALSENYFIYDKFGLAKLFLCETIGGYYVDILVRPVVDIFEMSKPSEFFVVSSPVEDYRIDLDILGARPRLPCLMNATDNIISKIMKRENDISIEHSISNQIHSRTPVSGSVSFDGRRFWNLYMKKTSFEI